MLWQHWNAGDGQVNFSARYSFSPMLRSIEMPWFCLAICLPFSTWCALDAKTQILRRGMRAAGRGKKERQQTDGELLSWRAGGNRGVAAAARSAGAGPDQQEPVGPSSCFDWTAPAKTL